MISRRLKYIASFINKDDQVLDIGTDHALLPIYLINSDITMVADGSDISSKVLEKAKSNVIKYKLENKIDLFLSDGLEDVDISRYNTLVITGMGFYTIKNILKDKELNNINKIIIQSNNNVDLLRKFVSDIGYKIVSDKYIFERNKAYSIIVLEKGFQKLTNDELLFGIYDKDNFEYYKYMYDKLSKINENIPNSDNKELIIQIECLKKYLSTEKIEGKMN